MERCLLRTFGFVLHVDHPHKFVLNYCNLLKVDTAFKQEAWNLANDRYPSLAPRLGDARIHHATADPPE